jgi:hypothetical protein
MECPCWVVARRQPSQASVYRSSDNDGRTFERVFLPVIHGSTRKRSQRSGADNTSKRIETATKISRMTHFRPELFLACVMRWSAVLTRVRLLFSTVCRARSARPDSRDAQRSSSQIRYRSVSLAAARPPYAPATRSSCSRRGRAKPRAPESPSSGQGKRRFCGVDPPVCFLLAVSPSASSFRWTRSSC